MSKLYFISGSVILFFFVSCNTLTQGVIVSKENELDVTLQSINQVLNFLEDYIDELNLDAFFGITLALSQIEQSLPNVPWMYESAFNSFRIRCQNLINLFKENSMGGSGEYNFLFKNTLLEPKLWYKSVSFKSGLLKDFGLHSNWTVDDVMKNKSSSYHGLSSDQCLAEILENDCEIGSECSVLMLENRNDTLYVITHRLLFMQLFRGIRCGLKESISIYIEKFCSLIWRDAKTLEYLNFPNTDLFLEQLLLCGMEGYGEFLIERWRSKPIIWQTENGCYKDSLELKNQKYRRTANVIEFGCIDHTTGLGLATLSLNARYLTYTMKNL
ncbi:UPF0764 protein C16orf89-like [Onthophagus taurus]|uniref:UPF0764 protein C16orf89-like n=1 Tax=Onthophagus taurus TaxID=166361 RepID=UPI000C20928D|nr:UPF0764 protein C16orf89-like [Onthophagus taurus]